MGISDYLFIEDINLLKEKIRTNRNLYQRLVEQCKRYEDVILTEKHPKGSSSFMGMAAANLSLLSLLSREKRWIKEAKRWIFTALSYEKWGHTNLVYADINSSWLLYGLALSYSWLSDFMTQNEKTEYSKILYQQGKKKWDFKLKHKTDSWPVRYWQNHNWLNFTGLATVAYALKKEYPKESSIWLEGAKENFKKIFSLMPDDGSYYEGVTYWRYGIIWLIQYAHLIKINEGVDLFKKSQFLRNTFYYRLYQCSPVFEQNYNFGDCHDTRSGHSSAVYFKLASEYKIQEAQWMGENVLKNLLYREAYESRIKPGILPEAFLEMIWYDPSISKRIPTNLPRSRFFPDLGLLSCRSSWSPDAFSFSVKASCPGGSKQWDKSWKLQEEEGFTRRSLCHQHADDGAFLLWKGQNNYVIDDGYNREVRASEHNMIVFDGRGYTGEGKHDIFKKFERNQCAKIDLCKIQNDLVYIIMDLKDVYDKDLGIKYFKRHFFYSGDCDLVIFDEVESDNAETISWQIHTEDYLIKDNLRFRTSDGDFAITPLLNEDLVINRESKVVHTILNTQEPDKKIRRKMEKISFSLTNNGSKIYFLNHIQTGTNNKGISIKHIEEERWHILSTINGHIKKHYYFSKNNQKNSDKNDSSFKYIEEDKLKVIKTLYSGEKLDNDLLWTGTSEL